MIKDKLFAVGIAGSPRRMGNSSALLRAYLEGVSSEGFNTKSIYLNGKLYRGCQACDRCVRGLDCGLKDDLTAVFPVLQESRIWALASPIYYDGVSGQLKAFFDRLRFMTFDPYKLKGPRRAVVIVTYEDNRRKDYRETAAILAEYLKWNNRGDFGRIRIVAEPNLGSRDDWKKRPALLAKMKHLGIKQAQELLKHVQRQG